MRHLAVKSPRAKHDPIIVTVRPTAGRPGYYDALISTGEGPPVRPSRYPLLDACRALIAAGADPRGEIELWHAGATHYSLRATIGAAARLRVAESKGAPVFREWVPFFHPTA